MRKQMLRNQQTEHYWPKRKLRYSSQLKPVHLDPNHSEMDLAKKSMDKDRDDQYLMGPNGVTRPIEEFKMERFCETKYDESPVDGYNNTDRHCADHSKSCDPKKLIQNTIYIFASDEFQQNQVPSLHNEDITLRGSNSSANTTSHSALSSSEAMS